MSKKFRNRQVSAENENEEAVDVREEYEEVAPEVVAPPAAPATAPLPAIVQEPKVQFDSWYAARSSVIPAIHKKEILKADFKGRKVSMIATMAEFDKALKMYGVELA